MKNFDDIQSMWNRQEAGQLGSADDAIMNARQFEKSMARKLGICIVALSLTVIFLLIIWTTYQFPSVLTHVGLTIVVLTVSVFTILYLKEYRHLRHDRSTSESSEYLSHLKTYYQSRRKMARAVEWIYTSLLSAGILLYMYSLLQTAPQWIQIVSYGATMAWIIIATFWGHIKFKKQQKVLEGNIARIESILQGIQES